MTKCPNCQTELKSGVFSGVKLLNAKQSAVVNYYEKQTAEAYCTSCVPKFADKYILRFTKELEKSFNAVAEYIDAVPVVSLQHPHGWEYTVLDMVSGQSTTGTGVLTEFSSSWADFFGAQSNRHNAKLREGERVCKAQMRLAAIEMGADAIIGVDTDYSEVGGGRGMLMVAMAGTAIKLHNRSVLTPEKQAELLHLTARIEAHKELSNIDKNYSGALIS